MPHTSEIPLHVYQVLEEEYVSLHGPLEEGDVVSLPDDGGGRRLVVARRDWRFHRGHVKDPKGFALRLRPSLADEQGEAAESAKRAGGREPDAVSAYLSAKIPAETLRDVYRFAGPFGKRPDELFGDEPESDGGARGEGDGGERARARAALGALEDALNALLADASLYDQRAFVGVAHADATRALVNRAVPLSGRGTTYQDADDIAHFNRLLLEDAFPDELERVHDVRLAAVQKQFHLRQQSALCLSGGGTRSGTFALGLIQGLARHNLLKGFDYLSTVSGGGYIGGWLTAWLHRHRDGLDGVTGELSRKTPRSKIDPDPEPIRYLRQYSNFITPKVGLLSADTWTFVAIYLRNLLLNWAVIIPLALGVLALPRLYVSTIMNPLGWEWAHLTEAARATREPCGRVLGVLPAAFESRHALLLAGFVLAVFAVGFIGFNRPQQREQLRLRSPFWYRHTGQLSFLVCCLAPLVLSAFFLTVYWAWSLYAWRGLPCEDKPWSSYFFFGTALTFCGWLVSSVVLGRFGRDYWRGLTARDRLALATEFAALLVAGGAGALLFKLAENAESPIVAYVGRHWTTWRTELYAWLAVPGFLLAVLLAMTLFIGLTSHFALFTDEDREWWARAGAWFLIAIVAWLAFGGLVIFGPLVLLAFPKLMASAGGVSGLASLLAGHSAKTKAGEQKDEGGLLSSTASLLLPVLAGLFLAIVIALLSLLTSLAVKLMTDLVTAYYTTPPRRGLPDALAWLTTVYPLTWADPSLAATHLRTIHYSPWWLTLALVVVPFAAGLLAARLINLNRFSLHAGYRDRLIRGFLGASRGPGQRKPNPFTGFDPADNIRMHELRPALLHEADFQDFAGLARALRRAADPDERSGDRLAAYLYEKYLDEETRRVLDSYNPEALPPQALKVALVEDLNEMLEDAAAPLYGALDDRGHRLYEAEPFVTLRRDPTVLNVLAVARRSPHSTYALFLNRHILQTAYPDFVRAKYPPPHRLLHVVNTALNLVGGNNLAWQQRKAEPFSVSPLHAGCFRLGYRRARDYGGENGIALGTAVAISGAAASSNMGYYTSSPVLAMVMTLFNVRLGWWLGNPGPAGYKTYRRQSPIFSIAPVVYEAFGLTDDTSKYVYLTDGGHFENLALYEMVLRRCHVIVLSDAAADPDYQFNDLGNAVRKIRIDLGVPIEFKEMPIHGPSPGGDGAGLYWAVARVRYGCVDEGAEDGVLVYVKPAVYGAEPQDVLHYKKSHSAFPHESTADQFFDEPQFESYRMLGSHIADRALGDETNDLDLRAAVAALYWRDRPRWPDINASWLQQHKPKDGEA